MKNRILAALLVTVCLLGALSGCASKEKRAVGSCAGYDVLYEELRYVAISIREQNNLSDAAELKTAVIKQIAEDYAILVAAKTYFPELSLEDPDIQKAVDEAVEDAIEEYGSKGKYKSFLKENHLTEHYARLLLARAKVELKWTEKLKQELFKDSELESKTAFLAWLNAGNLMRARRIVVGDEAVANEIRADLAAGKSVEEATQGKSEVGVSTKFYLVRGYSEDTALEAEAFALSAQDPIGEVRQTETGYRLLVWEENDIESFAAYQLSTYLSNMQDTKYEAEREKLLSEAAKNSPFLLNDFGESLDLLNLK